MEHIAAYFEPSLVRIRGINREYLNLDREPPAIPPGQKSLREDIHITFEQSF